MIQWIKCLIYGHQFKITEVNPVFVYSKCKCGEYRTGLVTPNGFYNIETNEDNCKPETHSKWWKNESTM